MSATKRRSSTERLVARLRDQGVPIADGWEFHRTYAGLLQRQAEAWSWWIDWTDNGYRHEVGSCAPVRDLLRAASLTVGADCRNEPRSQVVEVGL